MMQPAMNSLPRDILRKLYADYGPTLLNEPERVDAFLADLCGEYYRERFLIVQAMRERIPTELLAQSQGRAIHGQRLSQRLESRYCISTEAAHWAIDSWSAVMEFVPFAQNGPHDGYHELDDSRNALSDAPQRVLCQLIADYGPAILIDPARVDALLADLCGPYARERFLLVHALHARVPVELLLVSVPQEESSHKCILTTSQFSTGHGRWLLQRFQRRFGFSAEAARWAIESCSLALNIALPEQDMTPMDRHVIPEEEIMLRILKHDARTETWFTATVWARRKLEERSTAEAIFRQKVEERNAAEAVVKRNARERSTAKAVAQQKAEERNAAEAVARQKAEEREAAREAARQKSREMVTTEAVVRKKAREQGTARIAARQIAEELIEAEAAVRKMEKARKPDRAVAYTKAREWVTAKAAAHRKAEEWVAAEAVAFQKAEELVAAKAADRQKAEEWLLVETPARQKAEEQVIAKRAARQRALELATAEEAARQKATELATVEETVRQKTRELESAEETVRQKTKELTAAKESVRQKTRVQDDAEVFAQQKEVGRDAAERTARQIAKEQVAAELAANLKDRLRLQIVLLLQARAEILSLRQAEEQDAAEETIIHKAETLDGNLRDEPDAAEEATIHETEIPEENIPDDSTLPSPSPDTPVEKQSTPRASGCWKLVLVLLLLGLPGLCILFSLLGTTN